MICKKLSVVALSGLTAALSLSAMAQDTTTSSTTMGSSTTMDSSMGSGTSMSGGMAAPTSMSMEPMQVTGTVSRYYTDRSGYVTAMDVQTPEGSRMVRFSPNMAQRLYSTYPVGGQITGTIQPSMSMGMTRLDLVSMGDQMPAAGMMKPNMTSDIETLKADPFIVAGSGLTQFSGKLKSVITDDRGEVLALVLSGAGTPSMSSPMMGGAMTDASAPASTDSSMSTGGTMDSAAMGGGMMAGGMMENTTLVRVPREYRHPSGAQFAGSDRVSPLFKGASVEVVGYTEAPRYGVVSAYGQRVAATALVVNGRAVGAVGLPRMEKEKGGVLLGGKSSASTSEETSAMGMGYSTYGMSTMSDTTMGGGMSSDPAMATGTMGSGS